MCCFLSGTQGDTMKIVVEIDEDELIERMMKAAVNADKDLVKRLMNGLISELLASLKPPLMRRIADKFIDMESEINYRMEKRMRK